MSPLNLLQGLCLKARGLKTKWVLIFYMRGGGAGPPQRVMWMWAAAPREEGTISTFLSCSFGQVQLLH